MSDPACITVNWPVAGAAFALTAPRFVAETVAAYRQVNGYAKKESH